MEVVTYKDIVCVQPGDELAVCPFERRAPFAFPDAFFTVSAGGNRVEDAVVAELDVEEEEGQDGPREIPTSCGSDENCNGRREFGRVFSAVEIVTSTGPLSSPCAR